LLQGILLCFARRYGLQQKSGDKIPVTQQVFYGSSIFQVENHVVGAPCGVMDQMASACGEANKLLAMVCQVSIVF
jgi:galactokinase